LNILLTGSHGFIGSHVVKRLKGKHKLILVDSFEERVHPFRLHGKNIRAIHYGRTTQEDLAKTDVVIHLAAQVGVADSMLDPFRYIEQNTLETGDFLYTMQCAQAMGDGPKKIVVASSMSVYGDPLTSNPVLEEHPVAPASIYGLTKFDQERLVLMSDTPSVALRFFNVYGPGQALHNPYTGVLANFANWLLNDTQPTVYEDGLQTRDFVYVEDVADAVVHAALSPLQGVYNVCTERPTTIKYVAEKLAEELGKNIKPRVTGQTRPGDIRHCIGSNWKLQKDMLNWSPRSFDEGIKEYAKCLLDT